MLARTNSATSSPAAIPALSENDRAIIAAAAAQWQTLGKGAALDSWLSLAPALLVLRRAAIEAKGDGAYKKLFRRLLDDHGFVGIKSSVTSAIMFCAEPAEHVEALREIRSRMTPAQLARLQSPMTAAQRITVYLRQQSNPSPMVGDGTTLAAALGRLYRSLIKREGRVGSARQFGIALADCFAPMGLLGMIVIAANSHGENMTRYRDDCRKRQIVSGHAVNSRDSADLSDAEVEAVASDAEHLAYGLEGAAADQLRVAARRLRNRTRETRPQAALP